MGEKEEGKESAGFYRVTSELIVRGRNERVNLHDVIRKAKVIAAKRRHLSGALAFHSYGARITRACALPLNVR